MRTLDPTALWRSTVGFDRLFGLLDETARFNGEDNYPPYNIEQISPVGLRITLAVAGFTMDDLQLTQEDNQLVIRGRQIGQKLIRSGAYDEGVETYRCLPDTSARQGLHHLSTVMDRIDQRTPTLNYRP